MNGRPLDWLIANFDGMILALLATFSAATISAMLRKATGAMIVVGLLSAFMLTGISVPLVAIHFGLHWVWWGPLGAAIGLTSLSAMWFAIKFAERLQHRAPDYADAMGKRLVPEVRDPPPGEGKP